MIEEREVQILGETSSRLRRAHRFHALHIHYTKLHRSSNGTCLISYKCGVVQQMRLLFSAKTTAALYHWTPTLHNAAELHRQ
jgi:hypothetical protein